MARITFRQRDSVAVDRLFIDGHSLKGDTYYVDSANGNSANGGLDPRNALATIDQGINKCTANQGDIVVVLPGHAESVAAAQGIDLDVAGVTVIGLGSGEDRPVITFITDTAADFEINAADTRIENLVFKCNIASQVMMVDVNASKRAVIKNCEFLDGGQQYLIGVDLGGSANDCDNAKVLDCLFHQTANGGGSAIELAAVADGVIVRDNHVYGDWDDAGIHNPTGQVLTHLSLKDNDVVNLATGQHAIEIVSASTGVAFGNRMHADTPGVVFDPGSLKCADNTETHAIDSGSVPSPAGNTHPVLGIHVAKADENLPQTGVQTLFTVAGGRVLVIALVGQVGTVIETQANATKISANPTTGSTVDLCATLDITADVAATLYGITGTLGDAMVGAGAGGVANLQNPLVVAIGVIELNCAASNTGTSKWDIWYIPLDVGARVS